MDNKPNIIFIDIDNTLIESPYPKIFNRILNELVIKSGKDSNYIWSLINNEFSIRERNNQISAFNWDEIILSICNNIGCGWNQSFEKYIEKHISSHGISVYNGVEESIRSLKENDYHIYCTTNGYLRYQKPILKATGLLPLFDGIITPDLVGFTKKSINFYENIIEKNKKPIIIGDSYKYDILYPKKFGFYTIWDIESIIPFSDIERFSNIKPTKRPHVLINDLRKLLDNQKGSIYSQSCNLTEYPNAIILNFYELINLL